MSALPRQILVIRHGEKPGDPSVDDPSDGPDLSTRGFERAGALAPYIPDAFGRPDFLFASRPSRASKRPVETITPLAKAFKLHIESRQADVDFQKVADRILGKARYAGKLVLICWHHGKIPELTAALGAIAPVRKWPGTVFDRVWQINYPAGKSRPKKLRVKNLPQKLLYGDDKS